MGLLHRHFQLKTERRPDALHTLLAQHTAPKNPGIHGHSDLKPFWGTVEPNAFTLTPCCGYRNAFVPKIAGRISPSENGADVFCTTSPGTAVTVIAVLWNILAACFLLAGLVIFLTRNDVTPLIFIIPLALICYAALLTLSLYSLEVKKAKKNLQALLETSP